MNNLGSRNGGSTPMEHGHFDGHFVFPAVGGVGFQASRELSP